MVMIGRLFATLLGAQRTVAALMVAGYSRDAISVVMRDGTNPPRGRSNAYDFVLAGGPLADAIHDAHAAPAKSALRTALAAAGLPVATAQAITERVARGSILVSVLCLPAQQDLAHHILALCAESQTSVDVPWSLTGERARDCAPVPARHAAPSH